MYDEDQSAPCATPLPIVARMAESVRELQRVLGSSFNGPDLLPVAEHLEAGGTLEPEAYGAYFALVRDVQDGRGKTIPASMKALLEGIRPEDSSIKIRMLGIEGFGRNGIHKTRGHFSSPSLKHTQIGAIPAAAHSRMRRKITDALRLIELRAPNAWQDVSQITTEIVAAYGVSRGIMTFDGCSSLERYGSILVNMRRCRSPLVLAETLVHESAHSLLFALSCNDHRVLNPPSELHMSPLRIDPRPLDGIYHAVFVLARMHGFIAEVASHPDTSSSMRKEAQKILGERKKNFLDGHAVLVEHARLTPIGQELLEDAFVRVSVASNMVEQHLL